ncbi:MAG: hypothetical protein ACREQ9_13310, partial [Candidatus Binatia bacterium]
MVQNVRGAGTVGAIAVLVGLAVLGHLSLGLVGGDDDGLRDVQAQLIGAHTTVLDDVMVAGYSPDGVARDLGVFQAATAGNGTDRVQFIADIDSDGRSERIAYEVRDGILLRVIEGRTA